MQIQIPLVSPCTGFLDAIGMSPSVWMACAGWSGGHHKGSPGADTVGRKYTLLECFFSIAAIPPRALVDRLALRQRPYFCSDEKRGKGVLGEDLSPTAHVLDGNGTKCISRDHAHLGTSLRSPSTEGRTRARGRAPCGQQQGKAQVPRRWIGQSTVPASSIGCRDWTAVNSGLVHCLRPRGNDPLPSLPKSAPKKKKEK